MFFGLFKENGTELNVFTLIFIQKGDIMTTNTILFLGNMGIGWIIGLIFLLLIVWYFVKISKTTNQNRKNRPTTKEIVEKEYEEGEISRKQRHDIEEKMDDTPSLKDPTALKHTPDFDPAKPFPKGDEAKGRPEA